MISPRRARSGTLMRALATAMPSSRQAASVTTTSALRTRTSRRSARRSRSRSACRRAGCGSPRCARPARGPSRKLTTSGCGFFSVKTWMALTWSASVIGLSTLTVSGTALPFSDSGGSSSFTLPALTGAGPPPCGWPPASPRASRARARPRSPPPSPTPAATPPAAAQELAARGAIVSIQSFSVIKKGHHVLDLLGAQDRLAAKGRRHAHQPLGPIIRRHDRRRVDPAGIDDPQPQLALRPARRRRPRGRARGCPGTAPRETARCGRAGTGRPGGWRRSRGRARDRPSRR